VVERIAMEPVNDPALAMVMARRKAGTPTPDTALEFLKAFARVAFPNWRTLPDASIRTDFPAIDIVLPLGTGSERNNIELRMCLRSIERHVKDLRHIHIVGSIPDWVKPDEVLHVHPVDEIPMGSNPDARIAKKIEWAFQNIISAQNLMLWNDDYLLIRDIALRQIGFYHRGSLQNYIRSRPVKDRYTRAMMNSYEFLKAVMPNHNPMFYDIHVPMLYSRPLFLALSNIWAASALTKSGAVVKTVYANLAGVSGEPLPDCKMRGDWMTRITKEAKSRWVISYSDEALRNGFVKWMAARFPAPSRWESA
jgi:hypothetical protein